MRRTCNQMDPQDPSAPSYLELILIALTGILHMVVELIWPQGSGATLPQLMPDQIYNFLMVGVWGGYVLCRLCRTRGIARAWGFRMDNFLAALQPNLAFGVTGGALMWLYGSAIGRGDIASTFWLALGLYPLYGVTQQFALQVLVAKNLRIPIPDPWVRAGMVGVIFSLAHFPVLPLMLLCAPAGVVFTRIFDTWPNLWAVGIVHGLLGALAYYIVLGVDPGAQVLSILQASIR